MPSIKTLAQHAALAVLGLSFGATLAIAKDGLPNPVAGTRSLMRGLMPKTQLPSSADASTAGTATANTAQAPAAALPPTRAAATAPALPATRFFTWDDAEIRAQLAVGQPTRIRKGLAGRSIAFRVTLPNGAQGYFKPRQSFSAANWYAEVAAYHLDRELGLGRVPAVVARRFKWEPLRLRAEKDRRVNEVEPDKDGFVRGALVWWVPNELRSLKLPDQWTSWLRLREWPKNIISPFKRQVMFRSQADRERQRRTSRDVAEPLAFDILDPVEGENAAIMAQEGAAQGAPDKATAALDYDTNRRAAELSDMILFDYLTLNLDRWGGSNGNVLTMQPGGELIYLDNGAGFPPGPPQNGIADARLRAVQKFRRSTLRAIEMLDIEKLKARLANEPIATLSDEDLHKLDIRRRILLHHANRTIRYFGDAALPWD